MLGKIIKYEFKATSRMVLLMFAAMIVMAGICAVLIWIGDIGQEAIFINTSPYVTMAYTMAVGLAVTAFALVILAATLVITIIIVVRFYRMLGDEGYLWFTLPATPNQHVAGKLIVSSIWMLLAMLVTCISIGVMLLPVGWVQVIPDLINALNAAFREGFSVYLWIALFGLMMLVSAPMGVLTYYAAIAIGPNFTKSRLGGSILAYVIIYVIIQILFTGLSFILMIPFIGIDDSTYQMMSPLGIPIDMLLPSSVDVLIFWSMGLPMVGMVAVGVACYLVTRHFLNKKLNLP